MTTNNENAVAETILVQLGGNKFRAMTGAKSFLGNPFGLTFSLPRKAKGNVNKVVVTLMEDDTYRMDFWLIKGLFMKLVTSARSVHADQLPSVFETNTGLRVSL